MKDFARRVLPDSMWMRGRAAKLKMMHATNSALLAYYRVVRGNREAVDASLLESLRAEFGEDFDGYIDWRDEMYQIEYYELSSWNTDISLGHVWHQPLKISKNRTSATA